MTGDLDQVLSKAYELIEADRLAEARTLLKPVMEEKPDNADVWWLYAHAVTDIGEARVALDNVIRLDPAYPEAEQLRQKLEQQQSPVDVHQNVSDDELDSLLDDIEFDDDETLQAEIASHTLGKQQEETKKPQDTSEALPKSSSSRQRLFLRIAAVAVVIAVLIIAFIILGGGDDNQDVTGTPAAVVVTTDDETTAEANAAVAGEETEMPETVTAESNTNVILNALSDITLDDTATSIVSTDLGNTLFINVCLQPEQTTRDLLNDLMPTIANNSTSLTDLDGIGVNLLDCEQGRTVNRIGIAISDARAYAEGTLDEQAFLRTWRAL